MRSSSCSAVLCLCLKADLQTSGLGREEKRRGEEETNGGGERRRMETVGEREDDGCRPHTLSPQSNALGVEIGDD